MDTHSAAPPRDRHRPSQRAAHRASRRRGPARRGGDHRHNRQQLATDDRSRHLLSALAKLPDAQREAITLAFYGRLTHTEIAAHLKLPLDTVKERMRLALTRLRGAITPVTG